MSTRCPNCDYDLSGLHPSDNIFCPECGTEYTSASIAKAQDRRLSRCWAWFYASPILALPGLIAYFIGYPILALALGTFLAHRALTLDEQLRGNPSSSFARGLNAFLFSFSWCLLSSLALIALFTFFLTTLSR